VPKDNKFYQIKVKSEIPDNHIDFSLGFKYLFSEIGNFKNYIGINSIGRVLVDGQFKYKNFHYTDGAKFTPEGVVKYPKYKDVEKELRDFGVLFHLELLSEVNQHKFGLVYEVPNSILDFYAQTRLDVYSLGLMYGFKF
jgi:hypothetical protein